LVVGKVYRSKRKDIWKRKVKLLKSLQSNIIVRDKERIHFFINTFT